MRKPRLALCSFSRGITNGIARMDSLLVAGLADLGFPVSHYVIDPRLDEDRKNEQGITLLRLDAAQAQLAEALTWIDIVLINGSFDPCVAYAAAKAQVPLMVEILHVCEPGGMHPATDAVICVSQRVRACQTHGACHVIPNGIDCETFPFKPGRRTSDGAVLLQVANSAKNLPVGLDGLFPDLAARHPNVSGILVGGRAFQPHPGLTDLGIRTDLAQVYHQADFNLLDCPGDAFGLTLTEGMACGCLPLANARSGAADFILSEETGWLVDGGSEAWLRCLDSALDVLGTPRHQRMQEQARETVERLLGIRQCVERYAAVLTELWQASPQRRQRPVASAWEPLLHSVLLARDDPPAALERLEAFISAGRPLEADLLIHPNGRSTLGLSIRLAALLLPDRALLARAFCALLRASRIRSPELDRLERQCLAVSRRP